MEKFTFRRGDAVKVCQCHPGVREALLSDGWKEDESKAEAEAEAKAKAKAEARAEAKAEVKAEAEAKAKAKSEPAKKTEG